jgi:hypothetical protein
MSRPSSGTPLVLLALACVVIAGCGAAAGPRPTLPRPSYAPVVRPTPDPQPAGRGGSQLTYTEWKLRFCAAQDDVFDLVFAIGHTVSVGPGTSVGELRRDARDLASRVARARSALSKVPPRETHRLVAAQREFLADASRLAQRIVDLTISRSQADLRQTLSALRGTQRSLDRMYRLNQQVLSNLRLDCQ